MRLRVLFSPCGLGLGHAGRCAPIARELEKGGAEVLFSTYRDGVPYIEREGFPVAEVPPIGFTVKPDGTVDFRQSLINPGPFFTSFTVMRQVDAEIGVMRAFKPDVVVSDTRVSPLIAAMLLEIPRVSILNQFQIIIPRRSRFLRLAKLVDAGALAVVGKVWTSGTHVLIPDFPPPYTLSAGNLQIPISYQRRVKLTGPILPVRPEELPSQRRLRKKLGLGEDKPLIFAPISGPLKERAYFTEVLQKIFLEFPEDHQIVMSLGYPNSTTDPIQKGNLTIYGWTPNRFEYLKACDLVIARAGHGTLAQSICYGKPLILVPTPNHTEQLNNAKRAVELGIAKTIEQENLSKETLLATVQGMLENRQFQEKAREIQKDVLKLNALETAIQIITEAAEEGIHNSPSESIIMHK